MVIMDREEAKKIKKQPKKKRPKKNKNHRIFYGLLCLSFLILTILTTISIIFNDLFDFWFYIILIIVSIILMIITFKILTNIRLRNWVKNTYSIITILFIIVELLFMIYGVETLKFLSTITDTGYRVESYGIYSYKNKGYKKLKDINHETICYLDNNDDLIKKVIKKINKQVYVDYKKEENLDKLIKDMDSTCNAIILSSSYESIINEEFEEDYYNMIKLESFDIVTNVKTLKSDNDITEEPFAIYISGIDSNGNIASSSRSDVNIIMAVNPKKHEILLVNTPRDYYILLPSKNKYDKLTHAGIYGVEESLKSLSKLYKVDIDYYVRINFKSFMKMIDALDGIEVDIRSDFCEQNSNRSFAKKDLICLKKGKQKLNGEQALAYARHRKSYAQKDRVRGENQMQIIEAMIDKAMSPKILKSYKDIIKSLEGRMITNMSTSEMYRFGKKSYDNISSWKVTSISALGIDAREKCYSTGSSKLYVMKPDIKSVNEIQKEFKNIFNNVN